MYVCIYVYVHGGTNDIIWKGEEISKYEKLGQERVMWDEHISIIWVLDRYNKYVTLKLITLGSYCASETLKKTWQMTLMESYIV